MRREPVFKIDKVTESRAPKVPGLSVKGHTVYHTASTPNQVVAHFIGQNGKEVAKFFLQRLGTIGVDWTASDMRDVLTQSQVETILAMKKSAFVDYAASVSAANEAFLQSMQENDTKIEIELRPPTYGLDVELTAAGFARHKSIPFVWTADSTPKTRDAAASVERQRAKLRREAESDREAQRNALAPGTHVKVKTSLTYKPKGARKPRSLSDAYWQVDRVNSDGTVTVVAQVQGKSGVFGGSTSSVTATVARRDVELAERHVERHAPSLYDVSAAIARSLAWLNESMQEWSDIEDVSDFSASRVHIQSVWGDALGRGEYHQKIAAFHKGVGVGVIKFATLARERDVAHVIFVEVHPKLRRRGIATMLYNWVRKNEGIKTFKGSTTDDGAAFRKAYDKAYPSA